MKALDRNTYAIEQALLGSVIDSADQLSEVMDHLQPEHFSSARHQAIYTAITKQFNAGENINSLLICKRLLIDEETDANELFEYISTLPKLSSCELLQEYAFQIRDENLRRTLKSIGSEIESEADFHDSPQNLLLSIEQTLHSIELVRNDNKPKVALELVQSTIKEIETHKAKDHVTGIQSGFHELDKITGGFQNGDLIILGARPGMGKSCFVQNILMNAAIDYKHPVALFTLDMTESQIMHRMIATTTEIVSYKLRHCELASHELEQLNSKIGPLGEAKLFVDDTAGLSIGELRKKALRLKQKEGVKMIVVDYIQLMQGGKHDNREQEIAFLSRNLKRLARELDIPIIVCSQLSRAVETRGGCKRPLLSDLRESGCIEQDSDIVMFLYRPEYYGIIEDWDGESYKCGHTDIIIAKHRNGSLVDVPLIFRPHILKFENADFDHPESENEVPF